MNLLQDRICKFNKPGDFDLGVCCGATANGQTFFPLPQNRRFVGFDWYFNCPAAGTMSLTERFAGQFVNNISDFASSEKVCGPPGL